MSVVDLGAERFRKAAFTDELKPRDALASLLAEIDRGEIDPSHLIVVMRVGEGPEGSVQWVQAGLADRTIQVGMLARAQHVFCS